MVALGGSVEDRSAVTTCLGETLESKDLLHGSWSKYVYGCVDGIAWC
jgi:hypothetical protein